jgi:hypothetical protein
LNPRLPFRLVPIFPRLDRHVSLLHMADLPGLVIPPLFRSA